jgi:hypothetical protein
MSLPVWERGLKQYHYGTEQMIEQIPPVWKRGFETTFTVRKKDDDTQTGTTRRFTIFVAVGHTRFFGRPKDYHPKKMAWSLDTSAIPKILCYSTSR